MNKSVALAVLLSLSIPAVSNAADPDLRLISHWRVAFDPLASPARPVTGPGPHLMLLQFIDHPTNAWLASLKSSGVELISFFPNAAYLVRITRQQQAHVKKLSFVRTLYPWTPELKFDPETDRLRAGKQAQIEANVVFFNPSGSLAANANEKSTLKEGGAVIESDGVAGLNEVVRVSVSTKLLDTIALLPSVIAVEGWHPPMPEDESAAFISSGRFIGTEGISPPVPGYGDWIAADGYDGTFVTAVVADTGVEIEEGHIRDRTSDLVHSPAEIGDSRGHGTFVAAEINGVCTHPPDPALGYHYATGVAPWTSVVGIPYLNAAWEAGGNPACAGLTDESCLAHESVTAVGTNSIHATLQNNSWGHSNSEARLSTYTSAEQQWDMFVRDADQLTHDVAEPLAIIFSAGNDGSAGLTRPHAAKNIITVGASANHFPVPGGYDTHVCSTVCNSRNINMMYECSSWGDTADGRIKPDLVAPGALVASVSVGSLAGSLGSGIDRQHTFAWGTSAAAPLVTGQAARITQKFRSDHRGASASPAMLKAIMIALADDIRTTATASCPGFSFPAFYNLDPATFSFPNNRMGWGRVNPLRYFKPGTGITTRERDQLSSDVLDSSGTYREFSYRVASSGVPLLITVAWTDKEGAINANPALVNDLDLEVETDGALYRGNVFGGGKVSTIGGSADHLNNVESVFLPRVRASQPVLIRVRGAAINGDGVPYNLNLTDQDFALFAYNVCENGVAPAPPTGLTGFFKQGIGVTLTWKQPDQSNFFNVYRGDDGGPMRWMGTTDVTTFTDASALLGGKYQYIIRAVGNCSESKDSNGFFITPFP